MSAGEDAAALYGSQKFLSNGVPAVACDHCIVPAASADDPRGNKQARDAARCAGLSTPEELERFHDEITGQGITDFDELVEIAKGCKAPNP